MSVRDPGWWHPAGTGPVKNEGKDNAVAFAGSRRNCELNAMCPFIINNFLPSARILGDTCETLRYFSVEGTRLDQQRINDNLVDLTATYCRRRADNILVRPLKWSCLSTGEMGD